MLPASASLACCGFQTVHLSFFSQCPLPRLVELLLKGKRNSSELVSSLEQAQTALCAGCWQPLAMHFRRSLKGLKLRASGNFPHVVFRDGIFSLSLPILKQEDWGCSRAGLLQIFIRWLWHIRSSVGICCKGQWSFRETHGAHTPSGPQPSPRGEQ